MRNRVGKLVAATLWYNPFVNRNMKTYRKIVFYISHSGAYEPLYLLPLTNTKREKLDLQRLWHNFYNSGLFLLDINEL